MIRIVATAETRKVSCSSPKSALRGERRRSRARGQRRLIPLDRTPAAGVGSRLCNGSARRTPRSCTWRTRSATCTSARSRFSRGLRRPTTSLMEHVRSKLPEVPRYRQRVQFLPLALGRPVWIDDPALQPRLPPAPQRAPAARRRRRAAPPGRPGDVSAARPKQAALGDVDGRGPEREPLGAPEQGAPRDGRRRRRSRAPVGDPRRGARARARAASTTGSPSAQPIGAGAGRPGARGTSCEPRRGHALARPGAAPGRGARGGDRGRPPDPRRRGQPAPALVAQRADRPTPALGLGPLRAHGREGDPREVRRHRQRRGSHGDRGRLPRAADLPRRAGRS